MENSRSIASLEKAATFKVVLEVLLGSFVLALSAQVAISVPFSVIPFTLQTAALFLISAALGPKKAMFAVLAYLGEGALGLPVFAQGMSGIASMIGPRAGYLAGFAAAAYVMGYIAASTRSYVRLALAFLAGILVIYTFGFSWLAIWIGPAQAFSVGVLPFIIGDALKILAVSALVKGIRQLR